MGGGDRTDVCAGSGGAGGRKGRNVGDWNGGLGRGMVGGE